MADGADVEGLKGQLITAKDGLRDLDEDIKKVGALLGTREFMRGRGRGGQFGSRPFRGRGQMMGGDFPGTRGRGSRFPPYFPVSRRQMIEERDFGEEIPDVPLRSSVVAKDPSKTREEALTQRSREMKDFSASRRLFQVGLFGTLSKCRKENKANEKQIEKQREVEEKLEAADRKEKQDLQGQRRALIDQRRQKQTEVVKIERQMILLEIMEGWEKRNSLLLSSIQTKARPPIFWRPKITTPASDLSHKVSRERLEKMMTRHRKSLEEELARDSVGGNITADVDVEVETVTAGTEKEEKGDEMNGGEEEERNIEDDINRATDRRDEDFKPSDISLTTETEDVIMETDGGDTQIEMEAERPVSDVLKEGGDDTDTIDTNAD